MQWHVKPGSAASEGLPHGADAVMWEADSAAKSYIFMSAFMGALTAYAGTLGRIYPLLLLVSVIQDERGRSRSIIGVDNMEHSICLGCDLQRFTVFWGFTQIQPDGNCYMIWKHKLNTVEKIASLWPCFGKQHWLKVHIQIKTSRSFLNKAKH